MRAEWGSAASGRAAASGFRGRRIRVRHLVRWGALGFVAAFRSVDARRYDRGTRVVLRTERGLELGEVLTPLGDAISDDVATSDDDANTTAGERSSLRTDSDGAPSAGSLLRGMTDQDRLLELRLLKNRDEAYAACGERMRNLGLDAALVDVEHLFDGRSLVFYFLGDRPPELHDLTEQLAEAYDARAQVAAFAETLEAGCGPGCGTAEASGGGCGDCSSGCAVASLCSPRSRIDAPT